MDNNERCEFMAIELKRMSRTEDLIDQIFKETRNDILYKSVLALTSESLLRETDEECVEKINTKGIVFDNFILVVLDELQEQNPQLKDEIKKLSDSHKQNIFKRDYHAFSIAEKLNLPKRFVMYMNKAQEWGLEKELIYLIMAGYDEDTTWKLLVGYKEWISSTEERHPDMIIQVQNIEQYVKWKITQEVIQDGDFDVDQAISDLLD